MSYLLSVDLGTTFSAAAISEGGEPRIVSLGSRTATIPSVVALRPDGTVLIGEAAERRAITDPTRVAREFKRRLGDPVSTIIGGTPYGAEMLMAHLLRGIVDQVAQQQGAPPDRIVLSHPANYGPYKLDLLEQVGHLAQLADVEFITEPQAAAVHYSENERIEPGEVVAVYDLGGGTFDAALVLRTDLGFELLGTPDGLERFGGIDLDEAVFMHVRRSLGGATEALNPADPAAISALARLREDCRLAKEGLSSDTDAAIPVMLPNLHTEVRLVRSEFEDMIRPRLRETIATLERVVRSAGLGFKDLSRVLLVGGSSRIPLVAEMVREATGRPVAVDAHPKHAIVLGAASAGVAGATRLTARAGASPQLVPGAEAEVAPVVAAEPQRPVEIPAEPAAAAAPVVPGEAESLPAAAKKREAPAGGGPRRPPRRLLIGAIGGLVVAGAAVALALVLAKGGGTESTTTAVAPEATSTAPVVTTTTRPAEATTTTGGTTTEAPAALPPVEGPAPIPDVATVYLTDYLLPGAGGNWGRWNLDGAGAPPEDITSDFYPALGPYDVRDRTTVARHFAQMRAAGIGTVIVQWDGSGSPGGAAMPAVLEMAERYGLNFGLLIVYPEPNPERFLGLAEEASRSFGENPRWLKMPGRDGEPQRLVVLAVLGLHPDVAAWRPVLEGLDLTVVVDSADLAWIEAGAAGLMSGRGGLGLDQEAEQGDFQWAWGLPDGALYVPAVSPGFSGAWAGSDSPYLFVDRRDGQEYRDEWQLSHTVQRPAMVVIDAFNAWFNGSQIEPAAESYPARPASPYSSYRALGPEGYLEITREMVDTVHPRTPEELAAAQYEADVRLLLDLWGGHTASWSGGIASGVSYVVTHNYPGLGYTMDQCLAYVREQLGWQDGGGEEVVVNADTIARDDGWGWTLPPGTPEAGQRPAGRIYVMSTNGTWSDGAGVEESFTYNAHATVVGSTAYYFWVCG
jgi:molecular chaperone DnaK